MVKYVGDGLPGFHNERYLASTSNICFFSSEGNDNNNNKASEITTMPQTYLEYWGRLCLALET